MKRRPIKPKTHQSIERTMEQLKTWCDAQRGRQRVVARALLVDPAQVARWIARGGNPRLTQYCELIDFLDSQVPTERKTQ